MNADHGPAAAQTPVPVDPAPAAPAAQLPAAPTGMVASALLSVPLSAAHTSPPANARGVIALREQHCTSCMICARECPDWCITIQAHQEHAPPAREGRRPRVRNVLDSFEIDFSLCMYCGICVEACPYDALFFAPSYAYAAGSVGELVHDRPRLAEWLADVPDPLP